MSNNSLSFIQITDHCIVTYTQPLYTSIRSERQRENEKNLIRGDQYNGYMSPKTKAKVSKFLSVWLTGINMVRYAPKYDYPNKPFPTFVTLTLSSKQDHTDQEIKRKLLNPFIQWMKKVHKVQYYFWRAEPQKNGNIHFHIICDKKIHWLEIQRIWNGLQNNLGYIDRYTNSMKTLTLSDYRTRFFYVRKGETKSEANRRTIKAYEKGVGEGWKNPNSTDIHALKKVKNLTAYVIKYCCKVGGSRKITGRIWGCADGLRDLKPYHDLISSDIEDFIFDDLFTNPAIKFQKGEFHTVFFVENAFNYVKKKKPYIYKKIIAHHLDSYDSLYRPKPKEIHEEILTGSVYSEVKEPEFVQTKMFYNE